MPDYIYFTNMDWKERPSKRGHGLLLSMKDCIHNVPGTIFMHISNSMLEIGHIPII